MTKLVMNGLKITPCDPLRPGKCKIIKGEIFKGFKIIERYKDQNDRTIYLVECANCKKQSYSRFKHPNKVIGCRSCCMKKNNVLHAHKIGKRIGTYTVTGYIRKENGVPYAQVKCDCGYEGTRRSLSKLGACLKCKHPDGPNNRVGKTIGKLSYTKYLGKQKYEAICDCGTKCIVHYKTKSCGCLTRLHNHRSKHTNLEIKALRELYEIGTYSTKDLCGIFSIDHSHLIKIIKKKRYKEI